MSNALKAIVGLVLIPAYHLPRIAYLLLLTSYAYVFNNPTTLTADPAKHLLRARELLRRGRNSELLYAALELRFALERMAQREILLSSKISKRVLDEPDPRKKIGNLHRLEPATAHSHEIILVNRATGERTPFGQYKPLDRGRVAEIQGRLGDLLHPKEGIPLGIPDHPWYHATREFLRMSTAFLEGVLKDNTPFFAYEGLDHVEMIKAGNDESA
ncbi:MAG: hypothetical protein ACHQ4J_10670 [Candidatus Binatia bacterium]